MSKPTPARYRTTNWSAYNAALRKRGSLLIWLDKEMAWHAPHEGRPGRPLVFADAAIQFCRSIKGLFKLPFRQTAGMVASLLRLAGLDWPVPDYSTLCRRQKTLKVQIPYRRAGGPLNLLVDTEPLRRHWSEPNGEGHQGPRRWRVASPEAWCSGTTVSHVAPLVRATMANGARSIWPWTPPHPTSARSSSPPAGKATAPFVGQTVPRTVC